MNAFAILKKHWLWITLGLGGMVSAMSPDDLAPSPARARDVSAADYDRIQPGMSYARIVRLIGPPRLREPMRLAGVLRCTWGHGASQIEGVFLPNGQLAEKIQGAQYHFEFQTCPGCAGVSRDPDFPDCEGCGRLGVVLALLLRSDHVANEPDRVSSPPGTRKVTCSLCGGSGRHDRMCYRCDNGYTYEGTNAKMTCSNCGGDGEVSEFCTHCGGSGYTWE